MDPDERHEDWADPAWDIAFRVVITGHDRADSLPTGDEIADVLAAWLGKHRDDFGAATVTAREL